MRLKYPGDEAFKKLIVQYNGNARKIADDPSVQVRPNTVTNWIRDYGLREFASEQRQYRESRIGRLPRNPGKQILEALLSNYKGDPEKMVEHPSIKVNIKTLRSWIEEVGIKV